MTTGGRLYSLCRTQEPSCGKEHLHVYATPPRTRRRRKPAKPHPAFPLTPYNNGQWCKKIRGKVHFFGVWEDSDAALQNYLRVAEDLHAGRQPRSATLPEDSVTVKQECNHYLTFPAETLDAGDLSARGFEDLRFRPLFYVAPPWRMILPSTV